MGEREEREGGCGAMLSACLLEVEGSQGEPLAIAVVG
jgi:hypothetical protein